MIPIPYKVLRDHKSHIRHEDTLHVGDHMVPVPCKVRGTIHTCGRTI